MDCWGGGRAETRAPRRGRQRPRKPRIHTVLYSTQASAGCGARGRSEARTIVPGGEGSPRPRTEGERHAPRGTEGPASRRGVEDGRRKPPGSRRRRSALRARLYAVALVAEGDVPRAHP